MENNMSDGTTSVLSNMNNDLPYERGAHLFSTRCSEAFEASLKANGEKCILWVLRYALKQSEAREFNERFEKIKLARIPIPQILQSGVDGSGIAYVLLKQEKLSALIDSTWVPVELEEKFISALKAVEALHRVGLVIGDIAEHTFLLDEKKSLRLGSLLGDFDFAAQSTALLPPAETINYVAPERNVTARADVLSDIYGLGIFAYRLFTGQYPSGKLDSKKPSSYRSDLPAWVDSVIGMCLMPDPTKRFKDVNSIIRVIEESARTGKSPTLSGIWTGLQKEKEVKEETKELVKVKPKQANTEEKVVTVVEKKSAISAAKKQNSLIWVFALLMGVGIAGFLFISIGTTKEDFKKEETQVKSEQKSDAVTADPMIFIAEYAPSELKDLILQLIDEKLEVGAKLNILKEINKSDDPASMEVVVSIIQGNYDLVLKTEAKKLLVVRLESNKLHATSDLLQDWVNFQTPLSTASTHIFRAIDQARPTRSRNTSLLEAANKDPITAIRFSAALSLDEEDPSFLESLKSLLSKQTPNEDFSNRGIGALLISHPALSIFLNQKLSDKLNKFSDADLTWSLLKSAESDLPIIKELAQEIIRRNILTPYQMVFIGVLVNQIEPGKSSHVFDRELVLAALGKIQSSDLYNFARWDSTEAEKVLLAICASSEDLNVVKESFDILAAKSLQNKLAASFIAWVKSGFWEYRSRMAKAVAIISMSDLASPRDLEQALDSLLPFAKGGLFKVISSSNDLFLIKETLSRMGELLNDEDLLLLLSNPSKEIRIEAVKALKGRNELEILRAIVAAYDKEKDQEVKKVYNELHWVTKNRKGF